MTDYIRYERVGWMIGSNKENVESYRRKREKHRFRIDTLVRAYWNPTWLRGFYSRSTWKNLTSLFFQGQAQEIPFFFQKNIFKIQPLASPLVKPLLHSWYVLLFLFASFQGRIGLVNVTRLPHCFWIAAKPGHLVMPISCTVSASHPGQKSWSSLKRTFMINRFALPHFYFQDGTKKSPLTRELPI